MEPCLSVSGSSGWFARLLLPGLAFKAMVIGGGYATGRELAAFFLPGGPRGGLYGMLLAMVLWSVICSVTFLFAWQTGSHDYRTFFRNLLGQLWPAFEIAYALAAVVILAVFTAAAGAIGEAFFGWPELVGALMLMVSITAVVTTGNEAVERLFKAVSIVLYLTYAAFMLLSAHSFGGQIAKSFEHAEMQGTAWALGGLTYAGYNILGAVLVLPVVRHLRSRRDAIVAGLLSGPLAMIPAMLFLSAWPPTTRRLRTNRCRRTTS